MKVKTWIPLVLAVVLGLAALKFTRDAMSRSGKSDDGSYVATVTAANDIAPGQPITAADLTTSKVEAKAVPTGSFNSPTDANLVERVSLTGLVKGQTVLESLLAPKGTAAGVQALIEPGMRAMTVQVDEWSGLAGLLLPGSRVDIIAVIRNDDKQGSTSRTIVQNVEVRAIGRQIIGAAVADPNAPPGTPIPAPTSVTLLVTPEQAEAIQLASVGGKPWLALRNSKDEKSVDSEGTSMADLRGKRDAEGDEPTTLAGKPGDDNAASELAFDPFAGSNAGGVPRAPRTRQVTFIRKTQVETVNVESAPAPPANWIGATTKDPADEEK